MMIKRHFLVIIFLPFISFGQWIRPYITGQGLGYSYSSKHISFYGIVEDDKLTVLGEQVFGPRSSPWHEYIRDVYDAKTGRLFASEILYPYDGSPTAHRSGQRFFRNANGFIVSHRTMGSYTDSLHYLRDKYGNVQRIDSLWYTLIYNGQTVDSSQSYLVRDTSANLILRDWHTADTLLIICDSCISQFYQGAFEPSQWILSQYHIDGSILYLQYYQPGMNLTYGIDILKFDISSGAYLGHLHFNTTRFNQSSGQAFRIAVEDSISMPNQPGEPYTSYNRIFDGQGQQLAKFSYQGDLFQGTTENRPFSFLNDTLLIICTPIHNPSAPSIYIYGSHIRVYDISRQDIKSAKFFASNSSRNFRIQKVLAVQNGYVYFHTWVERGSSDQDLLASIPLDLNFNDTLVDVILTTQDHSLVKLEIYPNPFTDSVVINSSRPYDHVIISSIDGRQSFSSPYSEQNSYSTESLKSGTYSIQVLFEGKVLYSSIMIKK